MLKTITVVLGLLGAGCSGRTDPSAATSNGPGRSASKKDPAAARALIADGALVLDVRSPEEFVAGHVPRAVNIPVEELPTRLVEVGTLTHGKLDAPLVVYCASGFRAATAQQALVAAGYTHVVNGGGISALQ